MKHYSINVSDFDPTIIYYPLLNYFISILFTQIIINIPSVYTKVLQFKVKTGAECAVCIQYMNQCALGEQRQFIDELNKNDKIKVVLVTSGGDHLIEESITKDLIHSFKDCKLVEVEPSEDEQETSKTMKKNFDEGIIRQGIFFTKEGHFLNKFKANFIVDSVLEIAQRK